MYAIRSYYVDNVHAQAPDADNQNRSSGLNLGPVDGRAKAPYHAATNQANFFQWVAIIDDD